MTYVFGKATYVFVKFLVRYHGEIEYSWLAHLFGTFTCFFLLVICLLSFAFSCLWIEYCCFFP